MPLSEELLEMIRTQFVTAAQAEVCTALLELENGRPTMQLSADRVLFDVLYLAAGDVARVRRLVNEAKRNPRDVISQEYFWRAGRSYPHTWARRHAVNRNMPEAPQAYQAVNALARLSFHGRRKSEDGHSDRATADRDPLRPRALLLSFADGEKLAELAGTLLALGNDGSALDLSPLLEYRWQREAPRTIVQCMPDLESAAVTYADDVLSWNGGSEYWCTCSYRLSELARSEIAAQLLMIRGPEDHEVIIGYRPPKAGTREHRQWY